MRSAVIFVALFVVHADFLLSAYFFIYFVKLSL